MLDKYIEEMRNELNKMMDIKDIQSNYEKILELSQKLDKFIFIKQNILIGRETSNYMEQLNDFLCPSLYSKVMAY
jgi:hypothetical protein